MTAIKTTYGRGGSALTPGRSAGQPDLATTLREIATDLAALRAAIVGITAKLDLDATVTDTDYASLHDPAALDTTAA